MLDFLAPIPAKALPVDHVTEAKVGVLCDPHSAVGDLSQLGDAQFFQMGVLVDDQGVVQQ